MIPRAIGAPNRSVIIGNGEHSGRHNAHYQTKEAHHASPVRLVSVFHHQAAVQSHPACLDKANQRQNRQGRNVGWREVRHSSESQERESR